MAQITTYKCDRCGAMKGGTNHWFAIAATPQMAYVKHWSMQLDGDRHVCGEKCAIGEVSDFMENVKRLPVTERAA